MHHPGNRKYIVNSQPDVCSVTWEVTDRCNFSCWYCPDVLHAGKYEWPNLEVSLRYFQFLYEKHPAGVFIDFIGGEPTLWPGLADFVESLPDGIDYEITTNGSRTMRWWERVGPRLQRVTISHHFASASDEHLLNLVKFLHPITHLTVLLLLDPEYCDRIYTLHEKLCELDINHETKPLFPKFGKEMIEYNQQAQMLLTKKHRSNKEQKPDRKPGSIWINDKKLNARDLIISHQNIFQGWNCLAGSRRLHIDPKGIVWAGSCRSKMIGNMTDLPLLDSPIICNKPRCTCIDDIKIEKWKDG